MRLRTGGWVVIGEGGDDNAVGDGGVWGTGATSPGEPTVIPSSDRRLGMATRMDNPLLESSAWKE
jgi:hypothetical protein